VTDDESLSVPVLFAGDCEPRSFAQRSGEHRLMLAVLADAVTVFVKSLTGGVAPREARAARAWLESRDYFPFTFECICEALGFDARSIRRAVWALRARPAEAAARLAPRRQPGPPPRPGTRPPATVHEIAPRTSVADVASTGRASGSPLAG
jgi:hypothetical protein